MQVSYSLHPDPSGEPERAPPGKSPLQAEGLGLSVEGKCQRQGALWRGEMLDRGT